MVVLFGKVEKTSKRGGKIISSSQIEKQIEEEKKKEQEEKESVANLLKNPTKVCRDGSY